MVKKEAEKKCFGNLLVGVICLVLSGVLLIENKWIISILNMFLGIINLYRYHILTLDIKMELEQLRAKYGNANLNNLNKL